MAEELFNPDELVAVLEDLARDIRKGYGDSLRLNKHIASRGLVESISTEIEANGTRYIVWLNLEDYWKYVEYDTKPHWPPPFVLEEWVKNKIKIGFLIPRPDDNGHIPTPKQLAYLIGRKIYDDGTTGTHDLKHTEDAILPFYEERLLEALHKDALNFIEKVMP